MKITKDHIGKKVKAAWWNWNKSVRVLLLSDDGDQFCGKNEEMDYICVYRTDDGDDPWELVEPKKKPSEIIIAKASCFPHDERNWNVRMFNSILDYLDEQATSKE